MAAVASLLISSCVQAPGLAIEPSSITLKVGEQQQLHPTIIGEGLKIEDVKKMAEEGFDEFVEYDDYYRITGIKAGKTRVGICIFENSKSEASKTIYEAWCTVTVVE